MTKAQVALFAIQGMRISNRLHIDIMEAMRTLKLSTEDASELRRMVGREWMAETKVNGYLTDRAEILSLAKSVTNQYATNYSLR